jgi:hypothetical protein
MFPKLKPIGEVRLLTDLVARNKITVKDHGPIPNQALILRTMACVKFRSSMDHSNWYFQIRVQQEDEKYNTIKTPFGSFACRVMLPGDTNAPATAIRVIEHILEGFICNFVWAYLDDINIYSDTLEEHIQYCRLVCQRLQEAQIYASTAKYKFFADRLSILGHYIDKDGIHTDPERYEAFRTGSYQNRRRNCSDS